MTRRIKCKGHRQPTCPESSIFGHRDDEIRYRDAMFRELYRTVPYGVWGDPEIPSPPEPLV